MRVDDRDVQKRANLRFMRESEPELEEIRQRERFKWFAERLEGRVDRHGVSELAGKLVGPVDWPGQREKALVLLALKGSLPALRTLEGLDLTDASESFRILYELCLDEALSRLMNASA